MKYLLGSTIINTDHIVKIDSYILRSPYTSENYSCVTITLSVGDSLHFHDAHESYPKALELYNLMLTECKNQ